MQAVSAIASRCTQLSLVLWQKDRIFLTKHQKQQSWTMSSLVSYSKGPHQPTMVMLLNKSQCWFVYCVVLENIHTYPPSGRSLKIPRKWGVSKAIYRKVCSWTGISRGGEGVHTRKTFHGGYGYFLDTLLIMHMFYLVLTFNTTWSLGLYKARPCPEDVTSPRIIWLIHSCYILFHTVVVPLTKNQTN